MHVASYSLVGLCLLLACGCSTQPRTGTFVGNPGNMRLQLAPTNGLVVDLAIIDDLEIRWTDCLATEEVSLDGDAVEVGKDELVVPGGRWCGVELDLLAPLRGRIVNDDGYEFVEWGFEVAPLQPVQLWQTEAIEVDEQDFVLELGAPQWFDLGLGIGENFIESDSSEGLELTEILSTRSSLFLDADGSGLVEPSERDDGPLASATEPRPQVEVERTPVSSCSTAPGSLAWPWWMVAGLLGLRRRRAARLRALVCPPPAQPHGFPGAPGAERGSPPRLG
ncbi:MAG: hypothetical protein KTR31_09995 [Myxococcales bacterium]|nr:hypothetical protein [Myxococcales bacterium]